MPAASFTLSCISSKSHKNNATLKPLGITLNVVTEGPFVVKIRSRPAPWAYIKPFRSEIDFTITGEYGTSFEPHPLYERFNMADACDRTRIAHEDSAAIAPLPNNVPEGSHPYLCPSVSKKCRTRLRGNLSLHRMRRQNEHRVTLEVVIMSETRNLCVLSAAKILRLMADRYNGLQTPDFFSLCVLDVAYFCPPLSSLRSHIYSAYAEANSLTAIKLLHNMSDKFGMLRTATLGICAAARKETIPVLIEAGTILDEASEKLHMSTRSAEAAWIADISLNGNDLKAGIMSEIVKTFESTTL